MPPVNQLPGLQTCYNAIRTQTGIVIPVYLPNQVDTQRGLTLLRETIGSFCAQLNDPFAICLSVDGEPFGAQAAKNLAQAWR